MKRLAGLCAAALLPAGCFWEPGRVFPVPAAEARAMLLESEVPYAMFGDMTGELDGPATAKGATDVEWTVKERNRPVIRYTARLTPVDAASTRVAVELAPADPRVAANMKENGSIVRLYQAAMEEKVAATLERRPFQASATFPAMGLAIAANHASFSADAAAAGEALRKQDEANIARAYAEEARGR